MIDVNFVNNCVRIASERSKNTGSATFPWADKTDMKNRRTKYEWGGRTDEWTQNLISVSRNQMAFLHAKVPQSFE